MTTAFKKRFGDYVRALPCPMKSWAEDVARITDAFKGFFTDHEISTVFLKGILFLYRFGFPMIALFLLPTLLDVLLNLSGLFIQTGMVLYGAVL